MSNENDPPWNNPTWRPQMVMYGVGVTGEPLPPLDPIPDLLKPQIAPPVVTVTMPGTLEGLQLQQLLANVTVLTEAVAKLTEQVKGVQAQLTVLTAQNAKPRKSAPPPAARKRR
jgi:hypothetical protein